LISIAPKSWPISSERLLARQLTLRHRTKKDYALALIRDLIVAGELDPGKRLNQTELADRLQISLTPIREALRQLEAEGLVDASAHRGVRVSTADHSSLENVYVVRRLLEPYAAARATANLRPSDCRAAADLLRRLERTGGKRDERGTRKANYDFHFLLYERCDLPLLVQQIRGLWARFPWDVLSAVPNRMAASREEHHAILEGMEARDEAQTAVAVEEHLARSYRDIARHLWNDEPTTDPYLISGQVNAPWATARMGPR
jgi:DNA-binding GntR family transcriptional regulator